MTKRAPVKTKYQVVSKKIYKSLLMRYIFLKFDDSSWKGGCV